MLIDLNNQDLQKNLVEKAKALNIKPYHVSKIDQKNRSSAFWYNYYSLKTKSKPANKELERILILEISRLKKLVS